MDQPTRANKETALRPKAKAKENERQRERERKTHKGNQFRQYKHIPKSEAKDRYN